MDERASTRDLIAALRQRAVQDAGCEGCAFEASDGGICFGGQLVSDAADRLEEYVERCARYADEAMTRSVMLPRGVDDG